MTSDDETSLPPSGSGVHSPVTTTVALGPPGPAATTASTVPDTAVVSLPGVPQQQRMVYGSNSGQLSGGVSTTNMVQSSVTTPAASPVDPNMLANLIQSGLIPPLQMAELQNKLSVMSMGHGGAGSSGSGARGNHYEKNRARKTKQNAAKSLPQVFGSPVLPVNQQAVLNVVKVFAKWLDGGVGSSGSGARGKHYKKNKAKKAKQKAAKGGQIKTKEHQVNRFGKVSKPPKKVCYRSSGSHRVDKCPYPFATPAE